jgi:hypothetical protein
MCVGILTEIGPVDAIARNVSAVRCVDFEASAGGGKLRVGN